ncbi:hypothetical protein SAY86_019334 [Trapa natans]|uniref:Uncharacterized protein n=1 Tax=Trapa natans TaxID=22666 RepID=A0AAN7R4L9_TRANT|nr:hypothetical protein SAY86_019334 [Trapa natans]
MKNRNKTKKGSLKETDDWCFVCKDGGDMFLCDHRGCVKVYHAMCVGRDESLKTEKHWVCERHTCFLCHKSAKFYCFCCPNAVCGCCNSAAEFARVKGNGGFCNECVKLLLHIEEKADYNADKVMLNFNDGDTHEFLFKEYWEFTKQREDLTLEDVYYADACLQKRVPVEIFYGKETNESSSESDEDYTVKRARGKRSHESVAESGEVDQLKRLRGKQIHESASESDECEAKKQRSRGRLSSKKFQEFEGWGSKPLICFLNSIGEDTAKELSRFDVDSIISRYIEEKGLRDQRKRRMVCCDDKLYAIFRKKRINRNTIFHLLAPHFEDMVVHSDEDEKVDDHRTLDEKGGKKAIRAGREGTSSDSKQKSKLEVVQHVEDAPQSCFAAINVNNLKLVYLRRSFVEELFKQPHTAEGKIVGSFVKVKRDQTYQLFKSSHQLLKVIGLKQEATATNNKEILLLVSSMCNPISINMLSDSDIFEEECEDLRERVKIGNFEKLIVEELQQKAGSLHEVITKLTIEKEIVMLQHLIDQANEKGWRREKYMYLDKIALLKTPAEQERRLKQVPKVIPEVPKLKPTSPSSYSGESSEFDEEETLDAGGKSKFY